LLQQSAPENVKRRNLHKADALEKNPHKSRAKKRDERGRQQGSKNRKTTAMERHPTQSGTQKFAHKKEKGKEN